MMLFLSITTEALDNIIEQLLPTDLTELVRSNEHRALTATCSELRSRCLAWCRRREVTMIANKWFSIEGDIDISHPLLQRLAKVQIDLLACRLDQFKQAKVLIEQLRQLWDEKESAMCSLSFLLPVSCVVKRTPHPDFVELCSPLFDINHSSVRIEYRTIDWTNLLYFGW